MRQIYFFFSFLILLGWFSVANCQINTDSLNNIIDKSPKNKKAEICNKIAEDLLLVNPQKTIEYADKALRFAERRNDNEQIILSELIKGDAWSNMNNAPNALIRYQKALQLSENEKNNELVARCYNSLGELSFNSGDYDKALNYFQIASDKVKNSDSYKEASKALNNMGVISKKRGKYKDALNYYNQALELDRNNANLKGISTDLNNIGLVYKVLDQNERALINYLQALEIDQKFPASLELAIDYNNIGMVYCENGEYGKAIDYFFKTLELYKKLNRKDYISLVYNNIGGVYDSWGKMDLALDYYQQAYNIDKGFDNEINLATDLNNLGSVYYQMKNYDEALKNYKESGQIFRKLGIEDSEAGSIFNIGGILLDMKQYNEAIKYFNQSLQIYKRLGNESDMALNYIDLGISYLKLNQNEKALANFKMAFEIGQLINSLPLKMNVYSYLTKYYEAVGNYQKALEAYREYSRIKDTIFTEKSNIELINHQTLYELDKKEIQLQLKNTELKKQKLFIYFILGGMLLFIAFLIQVFNNLKRKKKLNNELSLEKTKTDQLLLNIIPEKFLPELKETGKIIPQTYDNVTIFFSDIVNFTSIFAQLPPEDLIDELNEIFTYFDGIMDRHNCERIKTVGDAYMAVCGIPVRNTDHAENMMAAAIEVRNYLNERNKTAKNKLSVRMGINSGTVVGGMVGIKKYAFDIFGDTVNTASKMEHYSESMKINVTEGTYHRLKGNYKFIERTPIEVKGKGMLKMYFLED